MRLSLVWAMCALPLAAQVVPDELIRSILAEVRVPAILEHARVLTGKARYPNSRGFFDAARYVGEEARRAGLENVQIEKFERSRPLWDAAAGTLELVAPVSKTIATLEQFPLLVMQRSRPGDVRGPLVRADAVDVKGGVVLSRRRPSNAEWKALAERGAVGLICAERQSFFGRMPPLTATAWLTAPAGAVGMAISPERASELEGMLSKGPVEVRMRVETAESAPGAVGLVTGSLPGKVEGEDIVVVAHLDHQKPGANDNASGAAVLIELVRVLKAMGPFKRTVRFWWSTEIEAEQEYFRRHPEEARRIRLAVNLDQAGGDRSAENHMIVIYGPEWLPSWADDLIHSLVEDVASRYAAAEHAPSPLVVAEGGSREALDPVYWPYAPLSDHIAFEDRSVGVPAISLAVPSLGVIHSDADTYDRLDPTWLKRSAMFTAASAVWASNAGAAEARALAEVVFRRSAARVAAGGSLEVEVKRMRSVRGLDAGLEVEGWVKKLEAVASAVK